MNDILTGQIFILPFRDYLKTRTDNCNKFFLVIDNLWVLDPQFWDMLRVPLIAGGNGSKVLITTHNGRTCHMIPEQIHRPILFGLDDENCWKLIQSLALPQGSISRVHKNLVSTGKEIATRCHGSPMAAKALGVLLNRRNDDEWEVVLSEMRALKDDLNGAVLASLRISYHHLKYHLKQCFAYCSIFPNGYVFERDQVIRYWMAEGLIEPEGRRRLEAVGTKYFDELIWRSFFEKISIDTKFQAERYRMPSLMRDLAMLVSEYEFRSLDGKPLGESKTYNQDQVRYASFVQPKNTTTVKLECLEPYPNLRTLKFYHECSNGVVLLNSVPASFFTKFMDIRVLDMSSSDLNQVPDSVGELIHLRLLGLSNTKITTLPEKICDLFNLQTLELKDCLNLAMLPEGFRRLINLRHLDLHLDWEKISDSTKVALPQGIGELEYLQTLSRFNVASTQGPYCNINELNNLNLRGNLCILNLENVSSAGDAKNANLEGKIYVEKLMLRWDSSALSNQLLQQQSEKVITFLKPGERLRCLWIVNYPGINFPNWMGDASFSSLETIQISNCNSFSFLLPLSKLPWLENLQIDHVPKDIMIMPEGFPSLKHLKLLNLGSLKKLHLEYEISQLKQFYVHDCLDLQELFIHRQMHGKFEKGNCPNLTRITCVPQD